MIVQRFQDFIRRVNELADPLDMTLIKELSLEYQNADSSYEIKIAELAPLLQLFAQRWQHIVGGFAQPSSMIKNYTFNADYVLNQPWQELAKSICEAFPQFNYLKILIPSLLSHWDYNSLECLDKNVPINAILIADDGKQAYRIKSLFDRLQAPDHPFYVFSYKKNYKDNAWPRSFTLEEMLRLYLKEKEHFIWEEKGYEGFWDYLQQEAFPAWQQRGTLIPGLLKQTLKLVECYFLWLKNPEENNTKVLKAEFANLNEALQLSITDSLTAIDDVNHFYSSFIVGEEPDYLINILLALRNGNSDRSIVAKLEQVVTWICENNPAIISQQDYFLPVYKKMQRGPYYNFEILQQDLAEIKSSCPSDLIDSINQIDALLIKKQGFEKKLIQHIQKIPGDNQEVAELADNLLMLLAEKKQGSEFFVFELLKKDLLELKKLSADLIPVICVIEGINTENQIIAQTIIQNLRDLYCNYFDHIKDKGDYFYKDNSANKNWIKLAQSLEGAHWVNNSYFFLLIPTLRELGHHLVSSAPYDNFNFNQFMLSENEQQLIYLPDLMKNYFINKSFVKIKGEDRNLSVVEQGRLLKAQNAYSHFYEKFILKPQFSYTPLSAETIDKLYELINNSYFERGTQEGEVLTQTELASISSAWADFLEWYHNLGLKDHRNLPLYPKLYEEKMALDGHQVVTQYKKLFIKDVIRKAATGQLCEIMVLPLLAEVVCLYSSKPFCPKIEKSSYFSEKLRKLRNSPKKIKDKDSITGAEALRRMRCILISLFSHKFIKTPLTGRTIRWMEFSNAVTGTGYKIYDHLKLLLEQKQDEEKIKNIYHKLIQEVIKPGIDNPSFNRDPDTQQWLESIEDETLYSKIDCVDPKLIFIEIYNGQQLNTVSVMIQDTLKKIAETINDSFTPAGIWLKTNLIFQEYLKLIPPAKRAQLMSALKKINIAELEGKYKEALSLFFDDWNKNLRITNKDFHQESLVVSFFHLSFFGFSARPHPVQAVKSPMVGLVC